MALQLTPEQLQAFQQLTQAYQAQQQQIASLQQELHHLQVPAAAAGSSVNSSSESASAQRDDSHFGLNRLLSKPSVFHGEHGNRVIDWINEFDVLFENCDPHMPEARKITFAKQFLRDEALRWWISREQDVQRARVSPEAAQLLDTPAITTWNQFKAALKDYFSPRGASEAARNELHRLRQQQFRSLAAYADRFEATSRRIDVPPGHSIDEELVATFKAGISDGQIRLFLTNKQPRSLFQATQLALQAESDLRVSGFNAGMGRFGGFGRHTNASPVSNRFDRSYQGAIRMFPNPAHRSVFHAPSQSLSDHRPAGSTPMDLSVLAGQGSESDSDAISQVPEPEDRDSSESDPCTGSEAPARKAEIDEALEEQFGSCSMVQNKQENAPCPQCGCNAMRMQRGSSRPNNSGCWNCGQMGHLSRDCPKPHRQIGPASSASSTEQSRDRAANSNPKPRHF